MKKIATLLLTAGLVFAGVSGASAIDFKAKGQFIMSFDYGNTNNDNAYGYDGADSFEATQRVRVGVEAIASESLSGTVFFEMGNTVWGKASQGGALGTDGKIVEVKHAYLDWIVPNTELKVRMGLQALGLPSYTTGTSQVFVHDVAAVVLNNKFNDNVSVTAFWARPFNDNFNDGKREYGDNSNYLDNVDAFGLVVPMTFSNVKLAPWVMYTMVGQNYARNLVTDSNGDFVDTSAGQAGVVGAGLLPVGAVSSMTAGNPGDIFAYGNVWHAGLTGSATFGNPFSLAWDFNYGNAQFGGDELSREGFLVSLLAEYKMDWGTPGLYAWYTSGDDDSTRNGSERMPTIDTTGGTNEFSTFALSGAKYIEREGVLGNTIIGTWGIGARVADMSFMEDLKHTFAVNYYQGTNHEDMAKVVGRADIEFGSMYLTTEDWALEFNLTNTYKIYDNLTLSVEAGYIYFDMGADAWKQGDFDAFNLNTSFVYSF